MPVGGAAARQFRAQELQFTFSSIGGGVHLGLLAFKMHDVCIGRHNPVLAGCQLLCLLLVFARAYWLYINAILFFAPFESLGVFFLDVLIFLGGGLAILLVGHSVPLFSTASAIAIVMLFRLRHTRSRAGGMRDEYPASYRTFQRTVRLFFPAFTFAVAICGSFAGLLWWRGTLEVQLSAAFAGLCCVVAFRGVSPLYPVEPKRP